MLPNSFKHLTQLQHLDLRHCQMLSSLPSCFGLLRDLWLLDLSHCFALKMLPDSFKLLPLLQHLYLRGCQNLTLLSDILENMTKLEYLDLDGCTQLEELPHHITNQASLHELYLKGTSLREVPVNIGQLSRLRVMEIGSHQGCFQMESLPDSIGCLNLLERLVLDNLEVETLPKSLKQLINLQKLEIIRCPISELGFGHGPFSSSLFNLEEINLDWTRISKISISEDCCPALKILTIWDNEDLREIDLIPTALEELVVKRCKLLSNIAGIFGGVNLGRLMLRDCPELDTLPSFHNLSSLKVFILIGDNKVEMIQGLQHCTSLERLEIECKCWEVSDIESWEHVQRLRSLHLRAKKRSAVEPCIQTIQKWPEEIMVCTRAVPGAGSLLSSSTLPNLSVIHSFANLKIISDPPAQDDMSSFLRLWQSRFCHGTTMMLCLVINCFSPRMRLLIDGDHNTTIFSRVVEEGKWILVGAFAQHSACLGAQNLHIRQVQHWYGSELEMLKRENNEVEKGFGCVGRTRECGGGFPPLISASSKMILEK